MTVRSNGRLTVVCFISDIESDYSDQICRGTVEAAKEHDINLLLFPGQLINSANPFDQHLNVIYDLVNHRNVDGLILHAALIRGVRDGLDIHQFYKKYAPLPLVTIGQVVPGASAILLDNKRGLGEGINHLIRDHGRRKLAFVQGARHNINAEERYTTYLEVLKANSIPFDPNLVYRGSFSPESAVKVASAMVDKKGQFDAVIAANDAMALAILSVLQENGFRIPEDVSIMGFDNTQASWYNRIPLTTVNQQTYDLGRQSVDAILDLIRTGKPQQITMPTELVIRESCGCTLETARQSLQPEAPMTNRLADLTQLIDQSAKKAVFTSNFSQNMTKLHSCLNEELKRKDISEKEILWLKGELTRLWNRMATDIESVEKIQKMGKFFLETMTLLTELILQQHARRDEGRHLMFQSLRKSLELMVPYLNDREKAVEYAAYQINRLGFSPWYIYLYDKEAPLVNGESWECPQTVKLIMAQPSHGLEETMKSKSSIPTKDIMSRRFFVLDSPYCLVVNPLFLLGDQMGFILCNFNPKDSWLYKNLFLQISCIFRFSFLIQDKEEIESKLRGVLQELEEHNARLSNISQTDDLTGLYNRRGFLAVASQCLHQAYRMDKGVMLFYADMDGLKQINDRYGHGEGDYAICKAGELLKKTFRDCDVVSRFGGDEFTILAIGTSSDGVDAINLRLQKEIETYNSVSGKPWSLSITMGAVSVSRKSEISIEQLLSEADNDLYQKKNTKQTEKEAR